MWETQPLTGTLVVVVMPTPAQVASSGAAQPVIVNPTPHPTLSPSAVSACADDAGATGRLVLSLSAVVLPAALLLALLVARRRR